MNLGYEQGTSSSASFWLAAQADKAAVREVSQNDVARFRRHAGDAEPSGEILKVACVQLRAPRLNTVQIDEAETLYRNGMSLARIGERFAVVAHTVRRRLIERGWSCASPMAGSRPPLGNRSTAPIASRSAWPL